MDVRFLETFLFTADAGSFAEAGRRLNLTPATIAQRVRTLEAEVGAQLLVRSGRTVKVTESGWAILDQAREMVRNARSLRALAAGDQPVGELRLGAIATALTGLMPEVLAIFINQYPALEFHVLPSTSNDLFDKVVDGTLDAAVLVHPPFALPKTCVWRRIRTERLVVLGRKEMADRDAHDLLRTEPYIRYDHLQWGGRLAEEYLNRTGIRPNERFELDALDAIAVLVDRGLGVSLVPDWANPWPEGLSIVKQPLPPNSPVREIGLMWLRASPRTRLIEGLLTSVPIDKE